MSEKGPIRLQVSFSGHVQGVGFRFTTHRIARQFTVAGYVRNLANGQVELLLEGLHSEVHGCVDRVQREMAGHIQQVQTIELDGSGEFSGFEIRS